MPTYSITSFLEEHETEIPLNKILTGASFFETVQLNLNVQ
jgi:hypothetical protein